MGALYSYVQQESYTVTGAFFFVESRCRICACIGILIDGDSSFSVGADELRVVEFGNDFHE